jgi:hypothetical protein
MKRQTTVHTSFSWNGTPLRSLGFFTSGSRPTKGRTSSSTRERAMVEFWLHRLWKSKKANEKNALSKENRRREEGNLGGKDNANKNEI